MTWSGGTYTLDFDISAHEDAGGLASASAFQTISDDLATGINDCLHKGGQNSPSGDLPMGGNRHTNVAAANSTDQYLRVGQALGAFPVYMIDTEDADQSVSISGALGHGTSTQGSLSGTILQVQTSSVKPVVAPVTMALNVGDATAYKMTDLRGGGIMPGTFMPEVPTDVYLSGGFARVKPGHSTFYAVTASLSGLSVAATLNEGSQIIFQLSRDGDKINIKASSHAYSAETGPISGTMKTKAPIVPAYMFPPAQVQIAQSWVTASGKTTVSPFRAVLSTNGILTFDWDGGPDKFNSAATMKAWQGWWIAASAGT